MFSKLFLKTLCFALLLQEASASVTYESSKDLPQGVKQLPPPSVSENAVLKLYLMPSSHPLKKQLDELFGKKKALKSMERLFLLGFQRTRPQPKTKVIVTEHPAMKGYIFKLYTDDQQFYYRNEPEHHTWMLRAQGARLIREEIEKRGWGDYFKAPIKWIYFLPKDKGRGQDFQRYSILVEEKMDLLPPSEIKLKWRDGTMKPYHLEMLFQLINTLGFRGGCKWDNIPICSDGKIAFIDTQNHLKWPLPYDRLLQVLDGELYNYWKKLFEGG